MTYVGLLLNCVVVVNFSTGREAPILPGKVLKETSEWYYVDFGAAMRKIGAPLSLNTQVKWVRANGCTQE